MKLDGDEVMCMFHFASIYNMVHGILVLILIN